MHGENKRGKIFIAVIAALLMTIAAGFFYNTSLFENMLNQIVERYVLEANHQLAVQVSYQLRSGEEFVKDLADSLSRMPQHLVTEEFLERKTEALALKGIYIVSSDGEVFPKLPEDENKLTQWLERNPQIFDEYMVSYERKPGLIVFTAPFTREGEQMIVLGAQNYENLQSLVGMTDYQEQGLSLLFDSETNEVLMSGEDGAIEVDESMTASWIQSWHDQITQPHIHTENIAGIGEVYVAICKVESTSWVQMAIISSEFLTSKIRPYMNIYGVLAILVLLVFALLMWRLVSENKKKEIMFSTDPLTGGYNRLGFIQAAHSLVDNRNYSFYVIVYINVVNFKLINEKWSEEEGNRVLQFIYQVLNQHLKENELVCRSGMDRYFLLLKDKEDQNIAMRIQTMIQSIHERIQQLSSYAMDFYIGACRIEDVHAFSSAINKAIFASQRGINHNKCIFYDKDITEEYNREKLLNDLFEESIQNRDFQVYLQPKVSIGQNKDFQAEALIRWIHPAEGIIYPSEFIPLFEKNGKIGQLDLYVFEEVCRLESQWIKEKKEPIAISVNISRFHLRNSGVDIWKNYQKIKQKYHIPDGLIELEMTETIMLEKNQLSFVKQVLDGFHSSGFQVALDDFGFAYSSLALLKDFEVDTMKLDREFFVNENEKSRKIVASLIQLAHHLGMHVVAEGIEEESQVAMLQEMGCDYIQGFVFAKPMPIDEFEKWGEMYEENQY